jgi:GT2 family glycosyltransferase
MTIVTNSGTLLIVIYNKTISESITYKSLINYTGNLKSLDLLIWNNGPATINTQLNQLHIDKFNSVTIEEDVSNVGLAKIYNYAIKKFLNEFCAVFDDDSALSEAYISNMLLTKPSDCAVPILTYNGKPQSPSLNKKKIDALTLPQTQTRFRAVGSGLVIGRNIAQKMQSIYGSVFDEHFLLYGADTTFCIRLERAGLLSSIKIIPGFEHSYSRLSNEEDPLSEFRKKELAYDAGLRARYYKSKPSLVVYTFRTGFRSIKNWLRGKENMEAYIFHAIITGKHYRAKNS